MISDLSIRINGKGEKFTTLRSVGRKFYLFSEAEVPFFRGFIPVGVLKGLNWVVKE